MPADRREPFADMKRGDQFWICLLAACLLGPALAALYAIGQWLRPGGGLSWIDGLVQGVLAPPVFLAVFAVRRRWIRRRAKG